MNAVLLEEPQPVLKIPAQSPRAHTEAIRTSSKFRLLLISLIVKALMVFSNQLLLRA